MVMIFENIECVVRRHLLNFVKQLTFFKADVAVEQFFQVGKIICIRKTLLEACSNLPMALKGNSYLGMV